MDSGADSTLRLALERDTTFSACRGNAPAKPEIFARCKTSIACQQTQYPRDNTRDAAILPLGREDGFVEMLLTVSAWEPDFPRKTELLGFKHR